MEVSVRFGVGDGATRRATTWKCWAIVGAGKNDIYLANRHLAGALKASLHESGKWHIAFERDYLAKHAAPGDWPTRVVETWDKPSDIAPGFTLAYRIITPSASVNVAPSDDERRNIIWVPPPPPDKAVEIDVALTAAHVQMSKWPGHSSMNTALVGRFTLDNGDTVWVISQVVNMPNVTVNVNRGRYFSGRTDTDIAGPDMRAILFGGVQPDGSRVMYDVVIGEGPGTISVSTTAKKA
jgi:hypothetical protein